MSQLADLQYTLHAHTFEKQDDEPMLSDAPIPDPFARSIAKAEFVKAGGTEAEFELMYPMSPARTLAKRADIDAAVANRLGFAGAFGSASRPPTNKGERTEERNGWIYKYDSAGEVISVQQKREDETLAKRDGGSVEIQKLADGDYFKNTYQDGQLVEMELVYANGAPSERFDAEGDRIG